MFNAEKWKIIDWAVVKNNYAIFENLGNNNIVYLPVVYENHQSYPIDRPFILNENEHKPILVNVNVRQSLKLNYYNKFFDFKWNIGIPQNGWEMELFYWDNEWISLGICIVTNNELIYENVPSNGLYLLKSHDWVNTWQRIFTIDNRKQVWY